MIHLFPIIFSDVAASVLTVYPLTYTGFQDGDHMFMLMVTLFWVLWATNLVWDLVCLWYRLVCRCSADRLWGRQCPEVLWWLLFVARYPNS